MEYSKAVLLLGSKITKKKSNTYQRERLWKSGERGVFRERESKVNRSHSQIESMLFEKRKTNRYKSQINIE